jgi:hypothetical protein
MDEVGVSLVWMAFYMRQVRLKAQLQGYEYSLLALTSQIGTRKVAVSLTISASQGVRK